MNKITQQGERKEPKAIRVLSRVRGLVGKERPASVIVEVVDDVVSINCRTHYRSTTMET
jgi:hypothetical protein